MITHIAKAGEEQNERVVVMSNDADVITYSLAYFSEFKRQDFIIFKKFRN